MTYKTDIVIFGGTGDLSERKLIPALYRAQEAGSLHENSRIIITARTSEDFDNYAESLKSKLTCCFEKEEVLCEEAWAEFRARLHTVEMDVSTDGSHWKDLAGILNAEDNHRVFYLAIPPGVFARCCQLLYENDLCNQNCRVVVEKPLGYDEASAEAINQDIARYFPENNIYRIDHYLGKETVQNLLALRFANQIFAQLWDGRAIDHVQISISETVGLEGRVSFYDEVGALRDMVQNHLLQLLCFVAMEPPNKLDAHSIRSEKIKVLDALRPILPEQIAQQTVRGQYVAGEQNGEMVPGYLEELNSGSDTETFVALKCFIDNWRWSDVPFYLRTGKRLKQRCAEIIIQFKTIPHRVYEESAGSIDPNRLVIRLQEEELIQLNITSKNMQSMGVELEPVTLNLNYNKPKSDAYTRLLIDAMAGDPALFIHRDEVRSAWRWVDPIINAWENQKQSPNLYRAGSWGPESADQLIQQDGREWFNAGEEN